MKILFISHTEGRDGWGRYLKDLRSALNKSGHDARIVMPPPPLRYLQGDLFSIARDALKVARVIRKERPRVVHITVERFFLLVPLLPLRGVRLVFTMNGTYGFLPEMAARWARPLVSFLYSRALARVDVVIPISNYTKDHVLGRLAQHGYPDYSKKFHVIHPGIEVGQYTFVETPAGPKTILTVVPLKSRKGLLETVRALGAYRRDYAGDFEFRIVKRDPDSTYAQKVEAAIAGEGLGDRITFLQGLSDQELAAEYERASLYLMLPQVARGREFEGFGLVYLEANAAGVPVIGSHSGGVPEAIKDGVSGYCVDANSPAEVAQKIHAVLDEGAISRKAAREWAQAHDVSAVAARVLHLYTQ